MRRPRLRMALVAAGTCVLLSLQAGAATITLVNLDAPGEGFNDPTPVAPVGGNSGATRGAQRLDAFRYATNLWAARLESAVEIRVGANFDPLPCDASSAILGEAAPNAVIRDFAGAPRAATWYPEALANKLAGVDLDPTTDDIGAVFNSVFGAGCAFPAGWYYGLDATPPRQDVDFVTAVLHELGHGLGFLTFVNPVTGTKLFGYDDAFMLWLEDHSTGKLFPAMTNPQRAAASIDTGDLHWVGAAVVAAARGLTGGVHPSGHVEMYAPAPLAPGSSVSHFSTTLTPDELMEPFDAGPNHDVGLTDELFVDIGWRECGNGIVSAGEQCDDANLAAGDGCDTRCRVERCFACAGAPSVCTCQVGAVCGGSCDPTLHCAQTASACSCR